LETSDTAFINISLDTLTTMLSLGFACCENCGKTGRLSIGDFADNGEGAYHFQPTLSTRIEAGSDRSFLAR
jgi:hypothetical protein